MSDPIKSESKPSTEQVRKEAVEKYLNAVGKEAKAAVVKEFPFLASVFSEGNHS